MTSSPARGDPMGSDAEAPAWKALHPASVAINLVPQAWGLLKGYWPLLVALAVGTEASLGGTELWYLAFFAVLIVLRTTVHWATLRYRVRDGRLEIRSGLLSRQHRLIGPDRIQNAELVRNPLHRLSGLVEVRIETAGDLTAEGLLSALSEADAAALLADLDALRAAALPAGPSSDDPTSSRPAPEVLLRLSLAEILAYGFSSRRAGVFAAVALVGMEVLQRAGPDEASRLARPGQVPLLAGLALGAFAGGWLLAVLGAVLKFHGYRLQRVGDRLVAEHGLLTRRRVELPLHRIQAVRVDEPLLRRVMGYATLEVETAGITLGPEGLRSAEAVLPMVDRERLPHVLAWLLPPGAAVPTRLQPAPARALVPGLLGALSWTVLVTTGSLALAGSWGLLATAAILPLGLDAWLSWRFQAWSLTDGLVLSRFGFWTRRTWLLPRARIQGVSRGRGPLLALLDLGAVGIRMAGLRIPLPLLRWDETGRCLGMHR